MLSRCLSVAALCLGCVCAAPAAAQGLLWNLPEDRTWVRYEGTYTQVVRRPNSTQGDLTLQWQRNLDIKSVGQEEAEHDLDHNGVTVKEMCRWIEFKVVTGKVVEGLIDAGPGGTRLYKVLVPESYIDGDLTDQEGIFSSYVPIVKGFRKLGDDAAEPIEGHVLQVYPNVTLLQHSRNLDSDGAEETIDIPAVGSASATTWKGSSDMETSSTRTHAEGELQRSQQMPFGVAKWTAKTITEEKNTVEPRSTFQQSVELTEQLNVVEIRTDAESELLTE